MIVKECKTYHAKVDRKNLIRMPDNKSVFKVYYVSIIKRDNPERYEWAHCTYTREDFEQEFINSGFEGIGFIISFPHITKVFRFSPYIETVLDVKEFKTEGLLPVDCSRIDGSHEFACYAESVISASEYAAWAKAKTVDDYIAFLSDNAEFVVEDNSKLKTYFK